MSVEIWGMIGAGIVALVAGLVFVRARFAAASGLGRLLVLGPVFEAVALAIFAAEHFLAARDLSPIVPRWLPGALFWTYFMGAALLAAAISFIIGRYVRWSASLLALFFVLIVTTIDLPNLPNHIYERLFWTLMARKTCFAGGAMVLACNLWPRGRRAGTALLILGRLFVACTFVSYAVEHFLFPRFVPGVPLEKMTAAWVPAPTLLACIVGTALLATGAALLFRRTRRIAAATAGIVLLLLTFLFYVPILITEIRSPLAVEAVNYVGDTLLFAATAFLAGFGTDELGASEPKGRERHTSYRIRIEAHGFWTAKEDVEPRLLVLASYAAREEPDEVAPGGICKAQNSLRTSEALMYPTLLALNRPYSSLQRAPLCNEITQPQVLFLEESSWKS